MAINTLVQYDATRLNQLKHDTVDFDENMKMLNSIRDQEEDNMSGRNVVISSEGPTEMRSDYFKNAKFSRG